MKANIIMGIIMEPKGIDLLIKSQPLTEEEKNEISEFIKKRKLKTSQKKEVKKEVAKRKLTGTK